MSRVNTLNEGMLPDVSATSSVDLPLDGDFCASLYFSVNSIRLFFIEK